MNVLAQCYPCCLLFLSTKFECVLSYKVLEFFWHARNTSFIWLLVLWEILWVEGEKFLELFLGLVEFAYLWLWVFFVLSSFIFLVWTNSLNILFSYSSVIEIFYLQWWQELLPIQRFVEVLLEKNKIKWNNI